MNSSDFEPGTRSANLSLHPASLASLIVDHLPLGIMVVGSDGRVKSANPSLHRLLGYAPGALEGSDLTALLDNEISETLPSMPLEGEGFFRHADHHKVAVTFKSHKIHSNGAREELWLVIVSSGDEGSLGAETEFDLKKRILLDRVQHALLRASRNESAVTLLCIEIDRFDELSQVLGGAGCDELQCQVYDRISQALRAEDTLARVESGRFVVVLDNDAIPDKAQVVASRVQESFDPPFQLSQGRTLLTASLGISISPRDGDTPDQLLASSYSAVKSARRRGAGQLAYHDKLLSRKMREQQKLEFELQNAILEPDRHFSVVYQPQVELNTGKCIGVEALIRWRHPGGEILPPGGFLPQAQKMGLLPRLDRWVLMQVINQWKNWQSLGAGLDKLQVSVNVDQQSLDQGVMSALPLDRFLRDAAPVLNWLTLEIANYGLQGQVREHSHLLRRLSQLGLSIAVDGIGNEAVDVGIFAMLPVSKAKINGELVSSVDSRVSSRKLMRSLHSFMSSLEVNSIVVGIESLKIAEAVRSLGISHGQGNYFSAPLSSVKLKDWLSERANVPGDTI
ncbi:PAS domain S-box-containing protein/diguanylate cyclase (GGDEF)-like protein [Halomonas ventosae]|uniref:PAS domain S-box-containing protein/diguanylate cyclase (GGDEF)-like protein n=1 Tax=Halomonas ventosae TaxID=229007 RepID=A0A4R6ZTZ3_9GAMM|nr:EAL domain-containing protein [Halomonas ventosae]TDR56088.1 PAS domain S-box-containing protein/diguanylate cyclase (GGDEF)-like protein [Halomonas ventosae]